MCYRVDTMSNKVGVRELRQQASALLRRVAHGETIEVTSQGHPIARIVPLRSSAMEQLVLDGRAIEPSCNLVELLESLGMPIAPNPSGQQATAALEDLRSDER